MKTWVAKLEAEQAWAWTQTLGDDNNVRDVKLEWTAMPGDDAEDATERSAGDGDADRCNGAATAKECDAERSTPDNSNLHYGSKRLVAGIEVEGGDDDDKAERHALDGSASPCSEVKVTATGCTDNVGEETRVPVEQYWGR